MPRVCSLRIEGGPAVNAKAIFKGVETVLVIDWPSKDVPESLARAGLNVVVRGGPGPEDYSTYEMNKGGATTARSRSAAQVVGRNTWI
jgi:hypothetical protein